MSWEATGWARAQRAGGSGPKAVLMVLAEHADEHGLSWPSTRTLAEEAECDQRTVRRHLDQLREGGLVDWKPGAGRGSNRYQLTMPEPAPRGSRRRSVVRHLDASQTATGSPVVRHSDASLDGDRGARSEAPEDRSEALDHRSETTRLSDQQQREQNRTTLEPREIEPTAAPQQYARRGEHVAPAELDRTAHSGRAFGIVAAWVADHPGVRSPHRRELARAVDDLIATGADRALIPAALDEAHGNPRWRDAAKCLQFAYDHVWRASRGPSVTASASRNTTDDNIRALMAGADLSQLPDRPAIGGTR